jgi:CrcB protein
VSAWGWAAFVLAGAVGAPTRYLVDGAVQRRARTSSPLGTFVVNASGSFVLGVVTGLALHHGLSRTGRMVVGTGFCGAYTTFSTFTFETVRLLEQGRHTAAVRVVLSTVVVCGLAAAAGTGLGSI